MLGLQVYATIPGYPRKLPKDSSMRGSALQEHYCSFELTRWLRPAWPENH
jgi:hypothetical protein